MGTTSDMDWRKIMGQCDIMVRAQGRTSWAYNLLGRSASKHFKASFCAVVKQSVYFTFVSTIMSHKRSREEYNASHASNTNNTPLGRPKARKTEHSSRNGGTQKSTQQTAYPTKAAQLHAAHRPASSHPSIPCLLYTSPSPRD